MIELALLAVLLGASVWYILSRRQDLDAAAKQLRRDTVVRDADGHVLFDGSVAEVSEETVEPLGDDSTGAWLRVRSLCRMPDGSAWQVVVETARTNAPAGSTAQPVPPAPL